MLCPNPLGMPGELVIPDNRFGEHIDGGCLAEYSQLFRLYELIEAGDVSADRLYLFQYRKFIGFRRGGLPATSPWIRIVGRVEADQLFPSMEAMESTTSKAIVGSMFELGGTISQNYALVHVIDDLVMFSACFQPCGLDQSDIRRFATFGGFIPSPALCLIDVDLFLRLMRTLRMVWNEYAKHYYILRTGYQKRSAGYLLERLHSYLLCKWLMDGSQTDIGVGHRFVVSDQIA
jgi:hypothetical protein